MSTTRSRSPHPYLSATVLTLALALAAAACGSTEDGDTTISATDEPAATEAAPITVATSQDAGASESENATDGEGRGLSGELDITNGILTNMSADCGDYDVTLKASVNDITRQIMFESGVTLTAGTDSCTLNSNNIPNHDFNDESAAFANDVTEVSRTFGIIRDPQLAAATTALDQQTFDGVFLNGVPIDLLSAGCYRPGDPGADDDGNVAIGCGVDDPWLTNPLGTDHKFGADAHNAHTQPDGTYHYHGNPLALFDDNPGPTGSPLIGFAADGFPIYGTYFLDSGTGEVRKASSGYSLKEGDRPPGDDNPPGTFDGTYYDDYEFTGTTGDLDECNGMEVDGQYGYYVTDEFPYLMFCLSGTPDPSFSKGVGGAGEAGGDAPDLSEAAATLGVTVEELQAALGGPPPDFEAAAETLGIAVEDLQAALPAGP